MYNERLKFLRERNGLTQTQIADIIGIERSQYAHYENCDKIMPINYLDILCSYYNVSFDYLFGFIKTFTYDTNYSNVDINISALRLKEFRKEHKLTQKKLSTQLNIAMSLLSYYEKGKHLISTHALYDICKKYNISSDYLLGKIDEPIYLKY